MPVPKDHVPPENVNPFARMLEQVVNHTWLTALLLIGLTVVAAIGQTKPEMIWKRTSDEADQADFSASDPQVPQTPRGKRRSTPNVQPYQVAAADSIIVCQSDAFFTPVGATAMRNVVDAVEALPYVREVSWLDRTPPLNIFGLPEPVLPRSLNASQQRFDSAKQRALENPLIIGQLLSADAQTMLLMVSIDWLFVTDDQDCMERLKLTAQQAAAEVSDANIRFSVTGQAPIRLMNRKLYEQNVVKYQIIGYTITLVMAAFLFRGVLAVIIVALAPGLGVFWTLGILRILELHESPFNSVILPLLLCMVGFTDGVHMMVQIRRNRANDLDAVEASKSALREVGLACGLTSLTTAIGFGSLVLARHEVVQDFGYSAVVGVGLTFLSVVTVIPLACCLPFGRRVATGYGDNFLDRNLQRISGVIVVVLRYRRRVAVGGVLLTLLLVATTMTLRPDERITSGLSSGAESVRALRHIDRQLGGMELASVEVNWQEDRDDYDPLLGQLLGEIEAMLSEDELLGRPLSLFSLVSALPGDDPPMLRMPLIELLPPPLKRAFFQPEKQSAQVVFRVQDIGIAQYADSFQRIETTLQQLMQQYPGFKLRLEGSAAWRWRNLYKIVIDLAFSLGTASIIIFLVISVVYRSLTLGLISIVPNVFPLAITGTMLVFAGQGLEIVSVCAFTVCLGIAVDDTIHFLTRFQLERSQTENIDHAICQAFVGVGTALILTTTVLIIGFVSGFMSDARDTRVFISMGIMTIGSALAADMTVLPALLSIFCRSRLQPQNDDKDC